MLTNTNSCEDLSRTRGCTFPIPVINGPMDKFPEDFNSKTLQDKINEIKEKQKIETLTKYRRRIYTEFTKGNIYPFEVKIDYDFTNEILGFLNLELNVRKLTAKIINHSAIIGMNSYLLISLVGNTNNF